MDKKIQKKKISSLMSDKNITVEDQKKLDEFSKLTQIIKLRNDDNDPVKIIIDKKNKNNELNVTEKNDNFQEYIDELKDLTSKIDDETKKIMDLSLSIYDFKKNIFKALTGEESFELIEIKDNNLKSIFSIFNKPNNKKHKNLSYRYINNTARNNLTKYYNPRFKFQINTLLLNYNNLEKNGNVIISIQWFLSKFIDFLYLASLLFEEVYIIGKGIALLKNFKNDSKYINLLLEIIKNNYSFIVKNKKNENSLISFLKKNYLYDLYFKKQIIENKKKELYLKYIYIFYIKYILYFNLEIYSFEKYYKNINKIIKNISNDNFNLTIKNKDIIEIFSNEYNIILNLIKKNNLINCLEVGSNFIFLQNLVNDLSLIDLTIIKSIKNKKIFGINYSQQKTFNKKNNCKLKIINITPLNFYNEKYQKKNKFDFIFLNDKFNFDFVLFFFIYSDKILNINGYIVINNSHLNSVSYCIKYIEKNINSYQKIGNHSTITIFKKIKEDIRDDNFFIPF